MTWKPVTELVREPAWYISLYGLAANRANAHAADKDKVQLQRAHDDALLLSLGCLGAIEGLDRDGDKAWSKAVETLDSRLFPAPGNTLETSSPPTQNVAVAPSSSLHQLDLLPSVYKMRPSRSAPKRHRRARLRSQVQAVDDSGDARDREFLTLTVEPASLILLAGIGQLLQTEPPSQLHEPGAPTDRKKVIPVLIKAVGGDPIDGHLLVNSLSTRPISPRARYNLACFYAQGASRRRGNARKKSVDRARKELAETLHEVTGRERRQLALQAWKDLTLKPALTDWADASAVLGPEPASPKKPTKPKPPAKKPTDAKP